MIDSDEVMIKMADTARVFLGVVASANRGLIIASQARAVKALSISRLVSQLQGTTASTSPMCGVTAGALATATAYLALDLLGVDAAKQP